MAGYTPEYWANIPHKDEAKRLGCTCDWWGWGMVTRFDPACPIFGRHHNPEAPSLETAITFATDYLTKGA